MAGATSAWAAGPAPGGALGVAGVAVVGIVEGSAVLVRQSTRYGLVEGVRLTADDIVEAAPGSHVQIEFGDGVILSAADGARVMLQPRWAQRRGAAAGPRAYVVAGWVKLSVPMSTPVESATMWLNAAPNLMPAPASAKADRPATLVLRLTPPDYAVFVEAGNFRMTDRQDAQRRSNLATNDFVWRQGSPRLQQANKPSVEFVAALPPLFRDVLPARAGKFADRVVPAKPLGDISYTDVAAWLSGEPALRASLVERWRRRAGDPAFRAALQANLAQHPEWELVVYPERAAEQAAERAAARAAQASR
ncbi:MAG: hypothetical protein IPG93_09870 [Burkholderiales bacterium]|nr:hypothetical protein [Burkholderiales bacterium]